MALVFISFANNVLSPEAGSSALIIGLYTYYIFHCCVQIIVGHYGCPKELT